ncbi:cold inducible RNA binding protein [Rhinolophus ferrumequinum]|uniref:Cold inducible RNA binding protein n=1 Tax=Rhinolophus ferrumequinum TaxID=59479 RepID=A0A7J7TZB4_RHIFE|nr:cold inducible RNA binding protein [Rhinolophus ferrumequinum]
MSLLILITNLREWLMQQPAAADWELYGGALAWQGEVQRGQRVGQRGVGGGLGGAEPGGEVHKAGHPLPPSLAR